MLGEHKESLFPCGCIGKQGSDPYCPCEMKRKGLEQSKGWTPLSAEEKERLAQAFRLSKWE